MKNFYIHTPFDCLIICNKEQTYLQAGQILQFDVAQTLSIYPTENNKNNIAFILDLNHKEDDSRYLYVNFDNEEHFYLKSCQVCQNYILSKAATSNNTCQFEIGENNLIMTTPNFKKKLNLSKNYESFQTGAIGEFFYCILSNKEEEKLILLSTSGDIETFTGEKISLTHNSFTLSQSIDDIARHTIDEEYMIVGDKIIDKNRQIGYQLGRAVIANAEQVIPYAFLEAVKFKDFELAFSYLDITMKRQLDKAHLEEFFGQIQEFYAINNENYLIKNKNDKKVYRFVLNENKISEIEIL